MEQWVWADSPKEIRVSIRKKDFIVGIIIYFSANKHAIEFIRKFIIILKECHNAKQNGNWQKITETAKKFLFEYAEVHGLSSPGGNVNKTI